jgi:hypothetical protein
MTNSHEAGLATSPRPVRVLLAGAGAFGKEHLSRLIAKRPPAKWKKTVCEKCGFAPRSWHSPRRWWAGQDTKLGHWVLTIRWVSKRVRSALGSGDRPPEARGMSQKGAESAPARSTSGRTGVGAKAAVPLWARNRLHRPEEGIPDHRSGGRDLPPIQGFMPRQREKCALLVQH